MDFILKMAGIFVLAAFELWAAIPAGLLLGVPPLGVAVLAFCGGAAGVLVVGLMGERARTWLLSRGNSRGPGARGLVHGLWVSYGVPGLGLLAPLIVGAPLGTVLAIALGLPLGRVLFWMVAGVALWSGILTVGIAFGLDGLGWLGR